MTSETELFVTETVRDFVLNKVYDLVGHGEWHLETTNAGHSERLDALPEFLECDIIDDNTDEKLGDLVVRLEFVIDGDEHGKWIETNVVSLEELST